MTFKSKCSDLPISKLLETYVVRWFPFPCFFNLA